MREKLIPINEIVEELPLNLELGPISLMKWQLFLQIDQSFQIHRSYGSMLEGEADELKVFFCSRKQEMKSAYKNIISCNGLRSLNERLKLPRFSSFQLL